MKDVNVLRFIVKLSGGNPFLTSFFLSGIVLVALSLLYLAGFQVGEFLASVYKK